jgi:hypothetical protein
MLIFLTFLLERGRGENLTRIWLHLLQMQLKQDYQRNKKPNKWSYSSTPEDTHTENCHLKESSSSVSKQNKDNPKTWIEMLMEIPPEGEGELVKHLEGLSATIAGMTKQDLMRDLIKADVDFNTVCFSVFLKFYCLTFVF